MKKIIVISVLSLFSGNIWAQGFLGNLQKYQSSLPEEKQKENTGVNEGGEPLTKDDQVNDAGKSCTSKEQNSLPLSYIEGIILSKKPQLVVEYDAYKKSIKVKSPSKVIGNCQNMIKWSLKKSESVPVIYAIEAKFSKENCAEGSCKYRVSKKNGEEIVDEEMSFEPSIKGFEECLKKTGVLKEGGGVDEAAIVKDSIDQRFSNIDKSGDVVFVSEGPGAKQIDLPHGSFSEEGCFVYEKMSDENIIILTAADQEKQRLEKEAGEIASCGDYNKIASFISENQEYASVLQSIVNELILAEAKKVAEKLDKMKTDASVSLTPEEIKVIKDFQALVVNPKVSQLHDLYSLYEQTTDPDAKKQIQSQMDEVKKQLKELNGKPYFTADHVNILVAKGYFDDAQVVNSLKLVLEKNSKVGNKIQNVLITPAVAQSEIDESEEDFAGYIEEKKEEYEIRTGQITGIANSYKLKAEGRINAIRIRTQNYQQEIQSEMQRMSPGGYCYRYFRNTQKCIADSQLRIQQLQAELNQFNKVDAERYQEYAAEYEKYLKWEQEGSQYVNGNTTVVTDNSSDANTSAPVIPNPNPNNQYNFDIPNTGGNQNPYYQQQYNQQQMYSPYGQQQQQPWYGQQYGQQQYSQFGQQQSPANYWYPQQQSNNGWGAYGQFGMNFGSGGGNPYSQYGNMGYPYSYQYQNQMWPSFGQGQQGFGW